MAHMRKTPQPVDAESLKAQCAASDSGCWVWAGAKCNGYGTRKLAGKHTGIHRKMFELRHGAIAPGMVIHHLCRNRSCINPDHLSALENRVHLRLHADKYLAELRVIALHEQRKAPEARV